MDVIHNTSHSKPKTIAIVGGGATMVYLIKHLVLLKASTLSITVFTADSRPGIGMPYGREWVGSEHLTNIACEEIPDLLDTPNHWLAQQNDSWLEARDIKRDTIGPAYLPTRLVLGEYLEDQFNKLKVIARQAGVNITIRKAVNVDDVLFLGQAQRVLIRYARPFSEVIEAEEFDHVVIATGHEWPDASESCFFESPWPISQLKNIINCPVGILGSSLSAVDACLTLALQNGAFFRDYTGALKFTVREGCDLFKLHLHSRRGLLPSLRFHFEHPRLELYQYISRDQIFQHIQEGGGQLSLDYMFGFVMEAFKEKAPTLYVDVSGMDLEGFVEYVYSQRIHDRPFDFLRCEIQASYGSLHNKNPIYWKEIVDDIVYTISFYAKYFDQKDMLRMREVLMPLVSHIVAFLPMQSGEQLLALYDAGHIESIALGFDYSLMFDEKENYTSIVYSDVSTGCRKEVGYAAFIDCRGQRKMPFEAFPFCSLVECGVVTPARLKATNKAQVSIKALPSGLGVMGSVSAADIQLGPLEGVAVDDQFRPLDDCGAANSCISILAAPHIAGLYPYYAGLPFCNDSAKIVTRSILGIK